MRQARSAFATSFFGCAGFEIQTSDTLTGDPDVIVADYPADGSNAVEVLRALAGASGGKGLAHASGFFQIDFAASAARHRAEAP
jgi:hypothetical protein